MPQQALRVTTGRAFISPTFIESLVIRGRSIRPAKNPEAEVIGVFFCTGIHNRRTDNMNKLEVDNLEVSNEETLITPEALEQRLPVSDRALTTVAGGRLAIKNILSRQDPRLFVIVGPCSIHDPVAAMDYARRLKRLADEVDDTLVLVMRTYFQKPRTSLGWKGFINDPYMDESFDITEGLLQARKLLIEVAQLGLPTATEALDPVTPQYLQDLISWSAIGARTTEAQTHREMASGLSSPVGFKNGTDGNLDAAINALRSVSAPHRFLGINHQGKVGIIHTKGNCHAHIVLRGGGGRPNYDSGKVDACEEQLREARLPVNIIIDCSHANSGKNPDLQPLVMKSVSNQIVEGNRSIVGLMMESNINRGRQSIPKDLSTLEYGVSVTDACVDWETTTRMIQELRNRVGEALSQREVCGQAQWKTAS